MSIDEVNLENTDKQFHSLLHLQECIINLAALQVQALTTPQCGGSIKFQTKLGSHGSVQRRCLNKFNRPIPSESIDKKKFDKLRK